MYLVETPFYGIANFHLDGNIAFVGFGAEKPPEEEASAKGRTLVRQRTDTGYVSLAILMRDLSGYVFFHAYKQQTGALSKRTHPLRK